MKIDRVKVSNIDEFGARTVSIRTTKGNFETPNRSLTSTESNYKKQVRILDEPFFNPLFESIAHFTNENVKAMHTRNGVFARRKTSLSSQVRDYSDVDMLTKFFPQMKKDTILSKDDIFTLVDLQRYCGYDLITIPDYYANSRIDDYEQLISKLSEQFIFQYSNAQPIPYVDMSADEDTFKKKVDLIWDYNGMFKVMGIVYRSPIQYYANYKYLRDVMDRDIWIHASAVDRYYRKNWTTSQMHIPQIYGIDTVSILSQRIGIEPPSKPIEKIKRYDSNTLGLIEIQNHRDLYGDDLYCDCPVCEGKDMDNLIRTYTKNHLGETDNTLLDVWCKLHESFSSLEEFNTGQTAINENGFKDYISGKHFVNTVLKDFS